MKPHRVAAALALGLCVLSASSFAAWEQPELFVREMRASFTSLQ